MAIDTSAVDLSRPAEGRTGWIARPSQARAVTVSGTRSSGLSVGTAAERIRRLAPSLRRDLALEIERGTPFLLVPVLLAAGALMYFSATVEPPAWALVAALALAAVLCLATSGRGILWHLGMAVTLTLAGASLAKLEAWRAGTTMLASEISTRVTGRVTAIEHLPSGRVRVTLEVLSTERPQLRYAPQNVRLTMAKAPEGLHAGALLVGLARLRPASGPVRPGSYDFAFRSYFDRIGAVGFYLGEPQLQPADEMRWSDTLAVRIENLRQATASRIRERIGGAEGDIAAALMVGVRAGIPEEASESLRRSGLYHIISISGLHMALVAWTLMVTIRAGLALSPAFAARHPTKKYAALAALLAAGAYLAVSGAEVAAQRSFIMLAVMLIAIMFDRAALTMRNLAISAIVVLAFSPHEVVGPSFQMSFAATAAIVAAYSPLLGRAAAQHGVPPPSLPRRALRAWCTAVIGLALASLVAGLATAMFGAYHFQRVSPMGLPANLASMPLVSLVIVPSALLAALTMPVGWDGPFLDAMGFGISGLLFVSDLLAERSPLDEVALVPGASVAILTIALVAATVATTRLRWTALPLAVVGLALLGSARVPDILVSEDARLIGVNMGTGLAVNVDKGNAFTLQNWSRAMGAADIARPRDGANSMTDEATRQDDPRNVNLGDTAALPGFACSHGVCQATLPSGTLVAYVRDFDAALRACTIADLVVVDAVPSPARCARPTAVIVSRQQLARHGSAQLHVAGAGEAMELIYAIPSYDRPWNTHRRFSRDARGIPPRPPRAKSAPQQPVGAASNTTSEAATGAAIQPD